MTMFLLKSDIFLLAGIYLLSRRIGEIGAKRMLWGIACFIDTPCSDFRDKSRRADGPPDSVAGLDFLSRRARRQRARRLLRRRLAWPDRGRPVPPVTAVVGGGPCRSSRGPPAQAGAARRRSSLPPPLPSRLCALAPQIVGGADGAPTVRRSL